MKKNIHVSRGLMTKILYSVLFKAEFVWERGVGGGKGGSIFIKRLRLVVA